MIYICAMQIIDTHNHIYLPEFDADRDEVVERSLAAGVGRIMMPNIDSSSVAPMLAAEERYPGICLPMMALHPTSVKESFRDELAAVEAALSDHRYYGIGETGIDLYWDKTFVKAQTVSFRRHLELAEEHDLPVIIHARESLDLIIEVISEFGNGRVKGIFHAFPGTAEDACRVTAMGFMIGIGGVVTFRNGRQGEAAIAAGINNIVLETDAPYLAPVPFRGKRNEAAYLAYVTDKLSELLAITPAEVADRTTENARRLFRL
ncbi:MAG TPA: TatD family hydrolase [Bacteroidales bacterium]|jgi:TatD DNase family protein|nr:TatD family hydrolase [Bacteroidales bacterium]HNT94400.1 TatD family hydrolase [Bacteroidales bacterium]